MSEELKIDEKVIKRIIREIIWTEFSQNIKQSSLVPDIIKQRHIAEGVRFIRAGLVADRPTSGEMAGAIWFTTDTNVLSIWDGDSWIAI